MVSNNGPSHSQTSVSWTPLQVVIGTFYLILGASFMLLAVALLLVKMEDLDLAILAILSCMLRGLIILIIVWNYALWLSNRSIKILGNRSPRISGWE